MEWLEKLLNMTDDELEAEKKSALKDVAKISVGRCPRCGKNTVLDRDDGSYICAACDYEF